MFLFAPTLHTKLVLCLGYFAAPRSVNVVLLVRPTALFRNWSPGQVAQRWDSSRPPDATSSLAQQLILSVDSSSCYHTMADGILYIYAVIIILR